MERQIKSQYLKFIALVAMKKKLYYTNMKIGWIAERNDKNNLEKIKELRSKIDNIKFYFEDIFSFDSYDQIQDEIFKNWDYILEMLVNDKVKYNLKLSDESFFEEDEELKDWFFRIRYLNGFKKLDSIPPFYVDIMNLVRLKDSSMLDIYEDIINHKLYNPNEFHSQNSGEPFWTVLPNPIFTGELQLIDLNRKVILDDRTNYYLLKNGSDAIRSKLYNCTMDSITSIEEANIEIDEVLDIIIKNKFSVIDTFRQAHTFSSLNYSRCLVKFIFEENYKDAFNKKINKLRNYLLSDTGINSQIENSQYSSIGRNENIDFYISLIEEKYGESNPYVNKLLKMKNIPGK